MIAQSSTTARRDTIGTHRRGRPPIMSLIAACSCLVLGAWWRVRELEVEKVRGQDDAFTKRAKKHTETETREEGGESFFLAASAIILKTAPPGSGDVIVYCAPFPLSQKTMYTHPINSIAATTGVIEIPPARRGWKSLQFNLRGFPQLYAARGCCVAPLPDFSINGLLGRSTTVTWEISVIDTFGRKKNSQGEATSSFAVAAVANSDGWDNLIRRSFVLDPSNEMLDGYGTLSFIISIKDEQNHFVPTNPLSNAIRGLFLDEASADVCIEVTTSETKDDGKKKVKVLGSYPAHRFILKTCAPMLGCGQLEQDILFQSHVYLRRTFSL
eukprot:scaffold6776_cov99-Skeletonema_dohrnii-CCMP3373.AAC.9